MSISGFNTKIGSLGSPDPGQAASTQETDAALQGLTNGITNTFAAVSSEAAIRANADATLAASISSEVTARQGAVSSEAAIRANADATLAASISSEVTARQGAVSSEATARANADNALSTALGTKADAATLTAGLVAKLNTSEVASDPAFPVSNNGKVPTQLAIKDYLLANPPIAQTLVTFREIIANFSIADANLFKQGIVYTFFNASPTATVLLTKSGAFAGHTFVTTDFVFTAVQVQILPKTFVEVVVTATGIFVRRKFNVITGNRPANITGLLHSDPFVDIYWDGSVNRQPTYEFKDTNPVAAWGNRCSTMWTIQGSTSNANNISATRYTSGRDITSVNTGRYFTRSGLVDVSFAIGNFGSTLRCSLMKELYTANFPAYLLDFFMGDNFNISYAITVMKNNS